MNIQPISSAKYSSNRNFGANARIVKDNTNKIVYRNCSRFFRNDLDWDKFSDILITKYSNAKKVNIYNYACSEGAEPFSLAMILIKKLGEKEAEKFFPIIASDIDSTILKNPIQGIIKPSEDDLKLIKKNIGNDYSKFFTIFGPKQIDKELRLELYQGQVSLALKKAVNFTQKDVTKDIDNINGDNNVVLCRNLWPYLSKEQKFNLGKSISNHLGKNSMLVIGGFDLSDTYCKDIFTSLDQINSEITCNILLQ